MTRSSSRFVICGNSGRDNICEYNFSELDNVECIFSLFL